MFRKDISLVTYTDINELLYLRQERENEKLDYKRDFYTQSKEFAKDVSAFANTKGGYILLGIDEETNSICGISDTIGNQKIEDWISNIVHSTLSDSIKYQVKFIPLSDEEETKYIAILFIEESESKPIYVIIDNKAIPYIRKGTSVFAAKPNDIKLMYDYRNKKSTTQSINQSIKGNNSIQIGINQGTIIKTEKITRRNEIKINPDIHISELQAKQIKDLIDKIVDINFLAGKKPKSKLYPETWNSLYSHFNITSYKAMPKELFDEVMNWLNKQIAYIHRPKLRKGNNDEWRKQLYGAIYAKSQNELKFTKEELYKFACEKLEIKKQITSLTDLSDTRLKKLYQLIFSQ